MDLENSDFDIKNFANLFAPVGPEPVRYRNRATGCPDLVSPGFIRFCERFKPLVIFDSLTKFLKGTDPFHPGEMSDLFDKLHNLCAAGATVILIHHATRDDALRYANSHQIGANVARAFAVVSEDRPQLRRVRLEGILSRSAEPITEHLIAFPVVAERGEFGLSANTGTSASELEALLLFVKKQTGEACFKEAIKKREGKRYKGNLELLDLALSRGLLEVREDGKVAFPNAGTPDVSDIPFPSNGTDGNGA